MSKGIFYKTDEEVELIRKSSLLCSKALAEVAKAVKPGAKTLSLDKIADQFIRDNGGIPAFKNYDGFPNVLCLSVNEQVVHGIPKQEDTLKEGDVISVDCGVVMNGFYGDMAYTFAVGEISAEAAQLLKVTKACLDLAIEKAVVGNRLGDISFAVQEHAQKHGYGVVRQLVGHGVGKYLHEKPEVPNFGKRGNGIRLEKGLVIAIEPMINMGNADVHTLKDRWTVVASDGKPSAHFEHTVAIDNGKANVLSTFKYIEEALAL